MLDKERLSTPPLGVCRRLYNFAISILSSRTLPNGLSREHFSNKGSSEIKIEFSETKNRKEKGVGQGSLQKGKKMMMIGSAENDNNVKIKYRSSEKRAQGVEPSFANGVRERGSVTRETKGSSDEDVKAIIPQERRPSRVFSNIDTRSEEFIRSRLEAMRRSH